MLLPAVFSGTKVAPHAGAWIETLSADAYTQGFASPPMRGRGLKQSPRADWASQTKSPPMRGRGLKRVRRIAFLLQIGRPPCGGVD